MAAAHHHVLFCTILPQGHVTPMLPLMSELTSRGARVTCVVYDGFQIEQSQEVGWPALSSLVTATGATACKVSDLCQFTPAQPLPFYWISQLAASDVPEAIARELQKEAPFTAVVYDPIALFGRTVAHLLKLPVTASISLFPCVDDSNYFGNDEHRQGCEKLKARYGLDIESNSLGSPVLHSSVRNIAFTAPALLNPLFRDHVSCCDIPRTAIPCPPQAPLLHQLQEAREAGKKIVLSAFGTVVSQFPWHHPFLRKFWFALFEALTDLPDVFCILSLGSPEAGALIEGASIPANCITAAFVPQLQILAQASVFITHCGCNSVTEAIHAAVPMLAVPFFTDQPPLAEQLTQFGAALNFPPSSKAFMEVDRPVSAAEIRTALQRLLNEPGFRAAAAALQTNISTALTPARAVDLILTP